MEMRKVSRTGSSLSLNLTKFLKQIGAKRGDKVYVKINNDKIIISKNKLNDNGKPEIISERVWREFEATLLKKYGKKFIMNEKNVAKKLEEAIKYWIERETKPMLIIRPDKLW